MAIASAYRTPGVYVEWPDANPQHLDVGRTDIAGFIGVADRGPIHIATKIESARQFQTIFGDPLAQGYLAYAVNAFFDNGGRTCWVVRVADPAKATSAQLRVQLKGYDPPMQPVVLQASPGAWGNSVTVEPIQGDGVVTGLLIRTPDGLQQTLLASDLVVAPAPDGDYQNLLGVPDQLLPEISGPVLVAPGPDITALALVSIESGSSPVQLKNGADGNATLIPDHFGGDPTQKNVWGVDALARVEGISFIAAPDLVFAPMRTGPPVDFKGFSNVNDILAVQTRMIASCMATRDRIALLDPPVGPLSGPRALIKQYRTNLPNSNFAALYYPWVRVTDPGNFAGNVRDIPPSGHVAGMFARVDRLRGVAKPPANEVLEGVWDLADDVDQATHGDLNDLGINVIRAVPGRGVLVLGTRTLDSDIRWRYVNVRRLFAMIETALEQQMQWVTFEPNNPRLWKEIDRAVRNFLEQLYRAGMLDGANSDDAYFVRCDDTTNPPNETGDGRVTCLVGIQPPYPAEFVVVRVGITRNGVEVEEKGAQDA